MSAYGLKGQKQPLVVSCSIRSAASKGHALGSG